MAADILTRIGEKAAQFFDKSATSAGDESPTDHRGSPRKQSVFKILYQFEKDSTAENIFQGLEKQTRLRREQIVGVLISLVAVYMAIETLPKLIFYFAGILYPICASVKAIRTEQQQDISRWLVYWSGFGTFILADSLFLEPLFSGFALYWLAKVFFILYLAVPQTNGSKEFFQNVVIPVVVRFDGYISQFFAEWQKNHKSLTAQVLDEAEAS